MPGGSLKASSRCLVRTAVSRFYAFLPAPPFPVVASSDFLCLEGIRPGDAGWDDLWVTARHCHADAPVPPLPFGGESFACPKITFASGFAEYVGRGGAYAIISYGAEDCYSRSTIVVHKKRVQVLLLDRGRKE